MMATAVHPYIDALLGGSRTLRSSPHAWLNARRGAALERANALSVPTTRDEEWRFTDLTHLTRQHFELASAPGTVPKELLDASAVPEATARVVFVDGFHVPELSAEGPLAMALIEALATHAARIEPYLARLAGFDANVFAALNTAHLRDGTVIVLPADTACETPIHIVHFSTRANTVSYPRCLVVAERGASCTIVEEHVGVGESAYFTNAVAEISVAESARLRHIRLQRESARGFHIGTSAVEVAKGGAYVSQTVTLGARLSRHELNVRLGAGAAADIDGLALISGRQLADTHTLIDHTEPGGRSTQLHKTIVDGAAHAVFNGKIVVRPGAQGTDSSQQSRNLLLSDKATVDTKPQLEIFADDVKCAHGATVGQLDAEQLFYLRSRGLPDRAARNLLTYAFGASVIERIPVRSVVSRLERAVMAQTGAAA